MGAIETFNNNNLEIVKFFVIRRLKFFFLMPLHPKIRAYSFWPVRLFVRKTFLHWPYRLTGKS